MWRYDPVLLTEKYTMDVHLETFSRMAKEIAPYADRCIFSFVEYYDKVPFNMPEIIPFRGDDKSRMAEGLGRIASENGLPIQLCVSDGDYSRFGITSGSCMTLDVLGKANGVVFKDLKHKGMRKRCHCMESRDIGWYSSCPNGCRYCYANANPEKARENYLLHDKDSPLLIGHLNDDDEVYQADQESFLLRGRSVRSLDDF